MELGLQAKERADGQANGSVHHVDQQGQKTRGNPSR